MERQSVEINNQKGSTIVQLPKELLGGLGVSPQNHEVMVLPAGMDVLDYFKKNLIFPKSIDALKGSSAYFCSIVPKRQVKLFLLRVFKSDLRKDIKAKVLENLRTKILPINPDFTVEIPLMYRHYFSHGGFDLIASGDKIEVWDKFDLEIIINNALKNQATKFASNNANATNKKTATAKNNKTSNAESGGVSV